MLNALRKGASIVLSRLRTQGWRTTALWAYARGVPYITGVPLLRYSRVAPALYVGPQYRARGKRTLDRAGITHIVNMRSEFDDAAHGLTPQDAADRYCHLPTADDAAPSPAHLAQGAAFIREAIGGGGKVYIHCSAGVGRAPTMAAAYLMEQGCDMDAALELIRRARPFINLTPPQIQALRRIAEERAAAAGPTP